MFDHCVHYTCMYVKTCSVLEIRSSCDDLSSVADCSSCSLRCCNSRCSDISCRCDSVSSSANSFKTFSRRDVSSSCFSSVDCALAFNSEHYKETRKPMAAFA